MRRLRLVDASEPAPGAVSGRGELGQAWLGEYGVQLRGVRDAGLGPWLTFGFGWEFVGVWDGGHCCAVVDREVLRLTLASRAATTWTVDELTWVARPSDVVLIGLASRRPGEHPVREPLWWRLPGAAVAGLRGRV